tara:strand:+ start:6333 stop:6578 length:246 start_codon:yes stop_codon:yes gene_type:complete
MRKQQPILPIGFSETTMSILNPKKRVIIDMIMVQLLSLMATFTLILVFASGRLDSTEMTYALVGLFVSILMLGSVYSRIAK